MKFNGSFTSEKLIPYAQPRGDVCQIEYHLHLITLRCGSPIKLNFQLSTSFYLNLPSDSNYELKESLTLKRQLACEQTSLP